MHLSPTLRTASLCLAAVLAPALLTQCKTSVGKSYKDVSYDPAKLKTPAGHGMERKDYPFDESGTYRKDWVKSNSGGRDRSASRAAPEPVPATTEVDSAATGSTSYPSYQEASAARGSASFVGPADAAAGSTSAPSESPGEASAPVATYHKVASGDTLFSLASRYKTSVAELKRVNALTSDRIRTGQSLRIP